jgi:hypothetical protein
MRRNSGKWVDKGTLVVLLAFIAGVVILAFFMINNSISSKKTDTADNSTAETASPAAVETEEPVDEADLTRYTCVISEEGEDTEGSEFSLEFNEKNGTYKEYLNAGTSSSVLENGTFTRKKKHIRTVDKKGNENLLLYEGKYLISNNALYDGKVPKAKTFNKTFTHMVENVSKIKITFKKDGTFKQEIIRYSGDSDSDGQSDTIEGTYEHDGKFIKRNRESGEKLMSLYVYEDTLCASYYKREKSRS